MASLLYARAYGSASLLQSRTAEGASSPLYTATSPSRDSSSGSQQLLPPPPASCFQLDSQHLGPQEASLRGRRVMAWPGLSLHIPPAP